MIIIVNALNIPLKIKTLNSDKAIVNHAQKIVQDVVIMVNIYTVRVAFLLT